MPRRMVQNDIYTLWANAKRRRRYYQQRLNASTFVPAPGKANMDEVNLDKWRRIEDALWRIITMIEDLPDAEHPPTYERFVEASLLDDWKVRYKLLAELDRLRAKEAS